MLVGFNTNISYKDKIYHVQTEDSGKINPVVVTLLYHEGAILASKKTDYSSILDDPEFREKVTKLMKVQHKGMIRDLLMGKHTGHYNEEEKKNAAEKAEGEQENIPKPEQAERPLQLIQVKEDRREKDHRLDAVTEEQRKQLSDSLDDILLSYIMKRAK